MTPSRESEPLVSVVTPVYNDERYVAECIESVLSQTYSNFEYVFLNNCSTDTTLQIAAAYAAKDSRIRVHSNDSLVPVLQNHNRALRLASAHSKYIKVVFADDWLFPECIERMVRLAEANPSVGIVGAYGLRGQRLAWDGLPYWASVVSGREICRRRLLGGEYLFGSPTSLLMRADLVRRRETFYNEANQHADTEACFDVLRGSDFGFVHQLLTYTRDEEDSLTSLSVRLNSYLPGFLHDLLTYGPELLTAEELAGQIRSTLDRYYTFLARSVFQRPGAEFWRFHEDSLRRLGHPLGVSRLTGKTLALLLDAALNPKRTIESLVATLHARKAAGTPSPAERRIDAHSGERH